MYIQYVRLTEFCGITAVIMILICSLPPQNVRVIEVIYQFNVQSIVILDPLKIGEGLEKEGKF